jgi:3-oxoacyl-[acyl-carrier protein] reductase
VALVTGAASGIGLAIARQLAASSHRVVLVDVNRRVREIAADLGTPVRPASGFQVDLAEESQILAMVRQVKALHGGCDVLVNCAGVAPKKDGKAIALPELETDAWELVMRINLRAPFILCREFLPGMQQRRFGRVVNIASITGRTFRPRAGIDYSVSKAGLLGLTRRLAGEYASFGITINSVAPGRVQTAMSSTSSTEAAEIARRSIPVGRGGAVDEVAAAVCFLASDQAAYITGACLDVNGGDFIG